MVSKKKESMNLSVFERLADRFFECQNDYSRGSTQTEWDIDIANFMSRAGEVLFEAISSEQIRLGDIPSWFRTEPKGTGFIDGNEIIVHHWDIYWWSAIKWLTKNKPDSVITFSGEIACDINLKQLEGFLHSSEDVVTILTYLTQPSEERLKRAFFDLAKASEDACLYLACIAGNQKPAETDQKTIWTKIKAGLWKLYEVTLKVIVDAVMGRVWPK